MTHRDRLVRTTQLLLRAAKILNRLFLAGVSLAFLLSWPFARLGAEFLSRATPGVDATAKLAGLRCEFLIGIVMAIATDRFLVAMTQIIDSIGAGDPFDAANARRLRATAWALLALQLLDIPASLLGRFFPSLGSAAPDPGFSAGGWVAVLMLFLLSRVFTIGSAMRDDLQGTI